MKSSSVAMKMTLVAMITLLSALLCREYLRLPDSGSKPGASTHPVEVTNVRPAASPSRASDISPTALYGSPSSGIGADEASQPQAF
ncbi:MAG: hypothetical protein H7240_00285 [Glaciimonas sp.]|nr:hypothetical protein [Glaciimonas sp.]